MTHAAYLLKVTLDKLFDVVRDTIETRKQRSPDFLIWLGGKLIAPMASSRLLSGDDSD